MSNKSEIELVDKLIAILKDMPDDNPEYVVFYKAQAFDELLEVVSNYLAKKSEKKLRESL
jgi:hypothetical protein